MPLPARQSPEKVTELQEELTHLRKVLGERLGERQIAADQLERLETNLRRLHDIVEVKMAKPAAQHSGGQNQHHVFVIYSL